MGDPWQDFDCSCHCSEHAQIMNATPPKRKHMYAPTFFLALYWRSFVFYLMRNYFSFILIVLIFLCFSVYFFFIIFNRIFYFQFFCFYWSFPMLSIFFQIQHFLFFFFLFTLRLFLLHAWFSFMLAFYYLYFSLYPSVFLFFFIPLVISFIVQDFYSYYILLFFYSFSKI